MAQSRQKYSNYCVLIAIFIFSRLLFLFFTPFAYYDEETRMGSIGHDILFENGLKLPFWGYLDSPHGGGSVFAGLAAIPFYLIFGDKYLSLKIAALTFSVLTLILWYRLLSAETKNSPRTFALFLIFFTFATPHYVQKSVILAGNTVELMFFNIAIIYYFWRIRNNEAGNNRYLLLGMLCGFSFWVQFTNFYLFCTIILTLFIAQRLRTAVIRTAFLGAGFLFGALPLWIYNFQYKWATFTADGWLPLRYSANLGKLKLFFSTDLPASFHFLDAGKIKAQTLDFIIYGIFIAAVLIHLWNIFVRNTRQEKKEPLRKQIVINLELFLILYLLVFVTVTSFTSFPVGGRPGSHGWNSMVVHNEYYIIFIQVIMFGLLILLNKYKGRVFFMLNVLAGSIFILGYITLFQKPYYNSDLFKPRHSAEANVYEGGCNYVVSPEHFLGFQRSIAERFHAVYLRGAREKWNNLRPEEKKRLFDKAERLGPEYTDLYLKL